MAPPSPERRDGTRPGGSGLPERLAARPRPSPAPARRLGRRTRRRRGLLALVAGALILAAFVLCLAVTRGVEGLVRLFTVPSLEAKSGRRYTPQGAVKRLFEKLDEQEKPD